MSKIKSLINGFRSQNKDISETEVSFSSPVHTPTSIAIGAVSLAPIFTFSKNWTDENEYALQSVLDTSKDLICSIGVEENNLTCGAVQNYGEDILTALPFAASALGVFVVSNISANLMGHKKTVTRRNSSPEETPDNAGFKVGFDLSKR